MKKNTRQIIISLIIGVLLFVITYHFISGIVEENKILKTGKVLDNLEYVFLKEDKNAGYTIKKEDLEIRKLEIGIEGGYKKIEDVEGKTLVKNMKSSIPLTKSAFNENKDTNTDIREGYRAVVLKAVKATIPPNFSAPCVVDLYIPDDRLAIKSIRVLHYDSKDGTLLVEIPKEDVMDFLTIANNGKITIITKNKNDEKEEYGFSYEGEDINYNFEMPPKITEISPSPAKYPEVKIQKEEKPKTTEVEIIKGSSKTKVEF